MIPTADEILAGYPFIARRYGVRVLADPHAVRSAVALARQLAGTELDEPAAVFFAFARHPLAFPGLLTQMTELLMLNRAHAIGLHLHATSVDLRQLYVPIATGQLGFADVQAWFATRLAPEG